MKTFWKFMLLANGLGVGVCLLSVFLTYLGKLLSIVPKWIAVAIILELIFVAVSALVAFLEGAVFI